MTLHLIDEMEMTIRRAELKDAPALAKLLREISWFAIIKAETGQETREHVERHLFLCLSDESHTIYVAEGQKGVIAGYASVHWLPYLFLSGPEGFVSELFVRESYRNQGLGSRLMSAVHEEAKLRGCARLSLINMRGRESYQREFYKKQGWQERPEAANFVFIL